MQALSSGSRRAGQVVKIGARISSVAAPLIVTAAVLAGPGCSGDEFCAKGSYECTTGGSPSGSGGSAGAGQSSGGSAAEAGNAASGGSSGSGAAGSGAGGDSGSASGGFAGTSEGGSSGFGDSGAGGDSGSTGAGGTSGNPVPCTLGDFTEGCVLGSDAGIFVSPSGDDDNAGASDSPLATISAAIDKARSGALVRPIFICNATYREHPDVHNDGYALHGGFACPDDVADPWTYDSAERAKIAPNTQGYALRARDLDGLVVSDLELIAANGTLPGESSIGVFVSNAVDVRFERVRIVAGDGVDGAVGTVVPFEYAGQAALDGNDASGAAGGSLKTCTCQGGQMTTGGQGGIGGPGPQSGSPGTPVLTGSGQAGNVALACSTGGSGGDGAERPTESVGGGALSPGALTEDGWFPRAGDAGQNGAPGQGGGGGAGKTGEEVGGGGGGACGGCGGKGATPGKGGGSSIGLLAFDAEISLTDSEIITASAGNGGAGIAGQPGQLGGTRGSGSGDGCDGGKGGKGGDGGASGAGAGGISVGILWSGETAPDVSDDTSILPGEPGIGGIGGAPLQNDGINGVSDDVLPLNG